VYEKVGGGREVERNALSGISEEEVFGINGDCNDGETED